MRTITMPMINQPLQRAFLINTAKTKTAIKEELDGTIAVLPDVGLTLSPEDIVVNTADVKEEVPVTVTLKTTQKEKHQQRSL